MTKNTSAKHLVIDSKFGYPEWIRNHEVFKKLTNIEKIFGRIGLPNFKEEVEIINTGEARTHATTLLQAFTAEINKQILALQAILNNLHSSTEDTRIVKSIKVQNIISLCNAVSYSLTAFTSDCITISNNKILLALRSDIFGNSCAECFSSDKRQDKFTFKKGEAIFKVYGKLKDMAAEFNVQFQEFDQWASYKDFNRTNFGGKKHTVVFSHTGEEGLWDIATISMRGIASCQSWDKQQSSGLIGSITSKYVACIYLASDNEIPGYGSKMINRCIVRLVINSKNRKPLILLDKMYPGENKETVKAFKRAIQKRTAIDVIYAAENTGEISSYYVPAEDFQASLKADEKSYMDNKMNFQTYVKVLKKPTQTTDITILTSSFKNKAIADLSKIVQDKRTKYNEEYAVYEKERAAYSLAKIRFEEMHKDKSKKECPKFALKEPTMNAELSGFFKGGVDNLLGHCEKKIGISGTKVFADLFLNNIPLPDDNTASSKEQYHRKFLVSYIQNASKVREKAWKDALQGTYMKAFSKSTERFFGFVNAQMRDYILAGIKELIKTENS